MLVRTIVRVQQKSQRPEGNTRKSNKMVRHSKTIFAPVHLSHHSSVITSRLSWPHPHTSTRYKYMYEYKYCTCTSSSEHPHLASRLAPPLCCRGVKVAVPRRHNERRARTLRKRVLGIQHVSHHPRPVRSLETPGVLLNISPLQKEALNFVACACVRAWGQRRSFI